MNRTTLNLLTGQTRFFRNWVENISMFGFTQKPDITGIVDHQIRSKEVSCYAITSQAKSAESGEVEFHSPMQCKVCHLDKLNII